MPQNSPLPMPTGWTYRGALVFIDYHAYVPNTALKPQGSAAKLVQRALDKAEDWPRNNRPKWTLDISPGFFMPMVVSVEPGQQIVWAVHRSHSRAAQLSPFVRFEPSAAPQTNLLTIELVGIREGPMITQLYPGIAMERPVWLPNTSSTKRRIKFWRKHAYVATRRNMMPNSITSEPPSWWRRV